MTVFELIDQDDLQRLTHWAQTTTPVDLDRALSYAVFWDKPHSVEYLLRNGAYVNAMGWTWWEPGAFVDLREIDRQATSPDVGLVHDRDPDRDIQRVVHVAYRKNYPVIVRMLLVAGADVKKLYKDVRTFLGNSSIVSHAILTKNKDMIRLFVQNGVKLKLICNEYGHTLLYQMSKDRRRQHVQNLPFMIKRGADVNTMSGKLSGTRRRPVFTVFTNVHACLGHNLRMLKGLMEYEVDINVFEKGGSPLRVAISKYAKAPPSRKQYHRKFVETLLGYNVDFVFHDFHDPTWMDPHEPVPDELFDMVDRYRREQSVDYINSVEFQDIEATDAWGKTALHRAVENGQYLQAKSLLEYGAIYDMKDHWSCTVHQRAMQKYRYYSRMLTNRNVLLTRPRHLIEKKMNECKRIVNMLVRLINRESGKVAAF